MNQHHLIATELVAQHRRDLLAEAERNRRIPRHRDRTRRTFLHR